MKEDQRNTENTQVSNFSIEHTIVEIDRVFELQSQYKQQISQTSVIERIEKLKRLLEWIESNREQIHAALYQDFKKPATEVDLIEIYLTFIEIRHTMRHLKKWMKPKRVHRVVFLPFAQSWIRYEPKGVVLIISPWNFPFLLTLAPLVSAIASGNCVFLKPSELSPNTSQLIRNMVNDLFPENEVAVFEGDKEVATELLKKPFNHIFFTGSSEVAKIVMRAAAEHLASVTLELGGKPPAIVDETADIKDAAGKIVWGKYLNAGQTCIAPDYVFVHEQRSRELKEEVLSRISNMYGESKEEHCQNQDLARIINQGHFLRIRQLLSDAIENGASVEVGGNLNEAENYVEPTVVSHNQMDAQILKEEIFGPVLPIITYQNLDEVIEHINSLEKPLALYIFSHDQKNIEIILSSTASGGVCINDVGVQFVQMHLPFGGINHSGLGNSHGFYGFKAFSHERAVVSSNRLNPFKLFFPPYTTWVKRLVRFVMKYI